MRLSVCTAYNGRHEHLVNFILGLRRSERPPSELVIAVQGLRLRDLPLASFPIRQVRLADEPHSVARARNAAAARSSGDMLVFLDADCIAHPQLLDDYAAIATQGGLLMGEVGFLPPGGTAHGIDHGQLEPQAVADPERPAAPAEALEPCRDYRLFSALNFAIPARGFAAAGGFDQDYVGEGGEDIDFSRRAMSAGLSFARARGAKAYHQHHRQMVPPVDRIDAILANAELFRARWNQPVMEGWLRGFELLGLAGRSADGWRKLREPDARDVEFASRQADRAVPSIAAMLDSLEKPATGGRTGSLRPAA